MAATNVYESAFGALNVINERHDVGGVELLGITTGFELFDYTTGGYRKDNMYAFAARPGGGKTAFVLSSLNKAIQSGASAYYLNLEMTNEQMALRLISSLTGVHALALERGIWPETKTSEIRAAVESLKNRHLYFDDEPLRSGDLHDRLKAHKNTADLDILAVDYLSLFRDPIKNGTYERMTEISLKVRQSAHDFDIPVIAISQMNRAIEGRENGEPQLSDLRDSGQVEQDATLVGFMHRPNMYAHLAEGGQAPEAEEASIIVRKNRHGAVGSIPLIFKPKLMLWEDSKVPEEEPPRRRKQS